MKTSQSFGGKFFMSFKLILSLTTFSFLLRIFSALLSNSPMNMAQEKEKIQNPNPARDETSFFVTYIISCTWELTNHEYNTKTDVMLFDECECVIQFLVDIQVHHTALN